MELPVPNSSLATPDEKVVSFDLHVCQILSDKISYLSDKLRTSDPEDTAARNSTLEELAEAVALQADLVARMRGANEDERQKLINWMKGDIETLDSRDQQDLWDKTEVKVGVGAAIVSTITGLIAVYDRITEEPSAVAPSSPAPPTLPTPMGPGTSPWNPISRPLSETNPRPIRLKRGGALSVSPDEVVICKGMADFTTTTGNKCHYSHTRPKGVRIANIFRSRTGMTMTSDYPVECVKLRALDFVAIARVVREHVGWMVFGRGLKADDSTDEDSARVGLFGAGGNSCRYHSILLSLKANENDYYYMVWGLMDMLARP